MSNSQDIYWFNEIGLKDLPLVGGKNAGLGEMVSFMAASGVRVPNGFAISANVYRQFIKENNLEVPIRDLIAQYKSGRSVLGQVGAAIRKIILGGKFNAQQIKAITDAYIKLCDLSGAGDDVAVRSSATAEDLPDASFAGQQESFLNVRGINNVLATCQECFASLYTDRAIAYRDENGFDDNQMAISVGVQQMVRSDKGSAGVMFTLDTETGFPHAVLITGSWGLGESVVKGSIVPDRFMVFKPLVNKLSFSPIIEKTCGSKLTKMIYAEGEKHLSDRNALDLNSLTQVETETIATTEEEQTSLVLNDKEILKLAEWAMAIEQHNNRPMDIEWAKDGYSGELFIVQARPETIQSRANKSILETYKLLEKGKVLVEGISVGHAIACGKAFYLNSPADSESFPSGAILVTERTDPDWVPIMRRAAGIVTDSGGATSHAAIVSRELKVPAIVGAGNATTLLVNGADITMDCSLGASARVYAGALKYEVLETHLDEIPSTKTQLMINAAMPEGALRWWSLPAAGIGLARIEFIISSQIRIHPMALLHPEKITDKSLLESIKEQTSGYATLSDYFVDKLAFGVAKIAASQYPKPVVVRMSDFKSNEYRSLLGGEFFEIEEQNPMLGLRGASRYYHPLYQEAFELECQAIKRVRETIGFDNVVVMIPFCRTLKEADRVLEIMAACGLKRGINNLLVYVMCEIPSNIILAEQFSKRFDGFSIGSNDLTQLILGIDRDSSELSYMFDARDEAVKKVIAELIIVAHQNHCKVGICGQAPSDHPDFAAFLVASGIDSISLNPDSFVKTARQVHDAEKID